MHKLLNSPSILIIEDDLPIRESIQDALEFEGYKVAVASNGQEGLDYLQSKDAPCLILLDMHMPVMNGREFLDVTMNDSVLSKIPVLIFSANATAANSHGSVGIIRKPLDLNIMLDKIEKYC